MAQNNSNSTMEMGTSDQVLVFTKRNKRLTFVLAIVAMVAIIGVVVALVVVFSGDKGGDAEPIISTTASTPTIETTTEIPDSSSTVSTTTTSTEPPGGPELDLESIIGEAFSPPSFDATWSTGNNVIIRAENGDLELYDIEANTTKRLVTNTSEILHRSTRSPLLSPDGDEVAIAYDVQQVYRHSFLALYSSINVDSQTSVSIVPPGLSTRSNEAFLQNLVWGPSGTALAFVYLNNIYYKSNLTNEAQQITTSGQLDVIYNGIPDWVYEEEVFSSNNALWFSADGTKLAFATFNDTEVRTMKVPRYGVPGSLEYQYTLHHAIRYPKPGTTNPTVTVTIQDLGSNANTVFSAPSDLNEPILKPVSFVTNDTIALIWTNREQNNLVVELCTFGSTCTRVFSYNETDGWVDNIPLIFNEAGTAFITILPQTVGGVRYKQIIQVSQATGVWSSQNRINTQNTVLDILKWTSDDVIWYKATATNDSSEQHVYSVNSSGAVSCFTCNIGDENSCRYNDASISDGNLITITCGGPNIPQVFIYNLNGALVRTWADNSQLTSQLADISNFPVTFRVSVPSESGLPNADVLIQAPPDYAQRTNVPLLVYVYGGPDTALVTKEWLLDWGTSLVNRWNIAVARIDGRGSGLRGVDSAFAVNRRLGTVEIEDQINVTRYLQQSLPWLDSNRTCIWGWSYGGYASSLALARGGDVFRCGIAVAPVVDWRFYDTIYTERYMDTPANNPQGYFESSLLTEEALESFRGKRYFLVHGTADDNVHYQHAMLLSRHLQRRDIYFEQMSYTDEGHGLIGVRPHLYHAFERFLRENLL